MDMFTNEYKINKIKSDLCFIHGTYDDVVPHKHTQDMYNNRKMLKKQVSFFLPNCKAHYIEGAGHNDIWTTYMPHTMALLDKILK